MCLAGITFNKNNRSDSKQIKSYMFPPLDYRQKTEENMCPPANMRKLLILCLDQVFNKYTKV